MSYALYDSEEREVIAIGPRNLLEKYAKSYGDGGQLNISPLSFYTRSQTRDAYDLRPRK